jgi:ABC-type lipoprotein export system ATPase subunit
MPTVHIVRETKIADSFRVKQIRGMFDYQAESVRHEWDSALPIENRSWRIGVIVGGSGSGKTTLAREAFPSMTYHEQSQWDDSLAVIDSIADDVETKEIVAAFNAVGFSSPPHWLKPFNHLSNGQKFRVELARCILTNNSGTIFDEFTSVVDRDVAKIGCAAISKALRKKESPPFIAVSCHYDILDWLDPDWVFDVTTQRFEWRGRRRFPEIKLDVHQTTTAAWSMFREHHYLDHHIHKAAQCFVALWNDKPVAFCSVLHFPHPSTKLFKREHRTVVLPDFQGVGIGNRLSEFVASYFTGKGFRFVSTTSAPSMMKHRGKSPLWRCGRFGHASKATHTQKTHQGSSSRRISAGFEYIGK